MRSLTQMLCAASRHDWLVGVIFVVSYAALFLLADEVHWHLPLRCTDLAFVDSGKSIVALSTVGGARNRNYVMQFDTQLNEKSRGRLSRQRATSCIGFSSDRPDFVTALVSEGGPRFEIRSLADPSKSLASFHVQIDEKIQHFWLKECCLIGSPPSMIVVIDRADTYLFDLSGNLISEVEGYEDIYSPNPRLQSSSSYFLNTANCNRTTGLGDLECYTVTAEGFKKCYQERTQVFDCRAVVSDGGKLLIHLGGQIRIIDLATDTQPETSFSWLRANRELHSVSSTGRTLLFSSTENWIVVSAQSGAIIGKIKTEPPYTAHSAAAISDDLLVYDRSRVKGGSASLVAFDWAKSSTKEYAFENPTAISSLLVDCLCLSLLLVWTGVCLRVTVQRKSVYFGIVVMFAMLSIWMRWLYMKPVDGYFYEDDLRDRILLLISWQVILSLTCVVAFRYMPISIATALTLTLASCIFFWARTDRSLDHTWASNMFLIAGVGLVGEFIPLASLQPRRYKIKFVHLLLLMTAIGIAAKLYSVSDRIDFFAAEEPWSPYDTRWPQEIAWVGGISQVLFTIWFYFLAKTSSYWVFAPTVLFVAIVYFLSVCHEISKNDAVFGILCATAAGSLIFLTLLNIIERCFQSESSGTDRSVLAGI